jgi:hypothetical protein
MASNHIIKIELHIFQSISTFSALLPLIVGSFALSKSRLLLWFWLFLLYGFLTDNMSMRYNLSGRSETFLYYAIINQNIYSLVDAVFLTSFLGSILPAGKKRKAVYACAVLLIPLWYYFYFILKEDWSGSGAMSAYYDTGYEMMLAFIAAYVALQLTTPNSNSKSYLLWFVIGIFFHNLIVFFTHAFIESTLIKGIWFITCTSNVITMIMYAHGFRIASNSPVERPT